MIRGMQYDSEKLQEAFRQSQATLSVVSDKSGVKIPTVHRVISFGRGRPENVDRVAKALGFRRGRKDVMTNGRRRSA